jgi:hypothetical protein
MDGFDFEVELSLEFLKPSNWGAVNAIITGLEAKCKFIPANFTEANFWTALAIQGAGAVTPGMSLSAANTNLVITGAHATATLYSAGPRTGSTRYGLKNIRPGEIELVGAKTWTAGAIHPLFAVTFT